MRVTIILATTLLGWSQWVAADMAAGDVDAGAAKAKACATCHNAMVSLKDRGAKAIVAQIVAIRSGDKEHLPGLAELNEEDLADIAAYLNATD